MKWPLNWCFNNEKIIVKNTKISINAGFKFLTFKNIFVVLLDNQEKKYFFLFLVNLIIINIPCKSFLITLKAMLSIF
jgi:hypothetical protein